MKNIILSALLVILSMAPLLSQDSFVIHDNINSQLGNESIFYNDADYATDPKAKFMATPATPYTEKTLPEEWDLYKWLLDNGVYNYKVFRDNLIAKFASAAVWDTLTTVSKQALVRNYVWKSAETTANLDLLYTQAERDTYLEAVIEQLNTCDCNFQKSSDGKYWNTLPDSTGIVKAAKLQTDVVVDSSISITHMYLDLNLTASQTGVNENTDIIFDEIRCGDIVYNIATGVVSLKAGKAYRLTARFSLSGLVADNRVVITWVKDSDNTELELTRKTRIFGLNSTTDRNNQPVTELIYPVTTDIDIKLRCIIYVPAGNFTIEKQGSMVTIQEL